MDKIKVRLSKAIRDGIRVFPHDSRGVFFDLKNGTRGACVLGCAIFTTYGDPNENFLEDLLVDYPELIERDDVPKPDKIQHHLTHCDDLRYVVIALYDDLGWSREQIADWLESEGL